MSHAFNELPLQNKTVINILIKLCDLKLKSSM